MKRRTTNRKNELHPNLMVSYVSLSRFEATANGMHPTPRIESKSNQSNDVDHDQLTNLAI